MDPDFFFFLHHLRFRVESSHGRRLVVKVHVSIKQGFYLFKTISLNRAGAHDFNDSWKRWDKTATLRARELGGRVLYVQAHVLVHVWLPSQGYSVVMKKYKVTMSKGVGGQSELAVW